MKFYELTYLALPEFTKDEVVNYHEKIKANLKKQECVVGAEQFPKKIELAYPVKKQTHGYLGSVDFQVEAGSIDEVKKTVEKEKSILRYLVVEKKKKELEEDKPKKKRRSLKPEKTTLKDLDEKINEII